LKLQNKLDLFNNPVGYRTSPCKMLRILLLFSGSCLKTEVFKQLYFSIFIPKKYNTGINSPVSGSGVT
jgi:hypothetical protein